MHRHRYVHQVGITQVDLGQTSGAFHHDGVVARCQAVVGRIDGVAQFLTAFLAEVVVGISVADGLPVEHNL